MNGGHSTRGWVPTLATVCGTVWLGFTSFGIAVPAVPALVPGPGAAAVVGAAFATTAVVALLLRPVAGVLAQRFATRRVLAAGTALAVAAGATYAAPWGLVGMFAARVATGAAEALLMTAGAVWAVALAPVDRRAQVVGLYGLSMWGGLTVGPLVGDVALRSSSPALVGALAAALPALALVLVWRLPGGPPRAEHVSHRLLPRAAVVPGLALAAGGVGYACVTSFGVLAMADRGIAGGASLLSLFGGAYVVVRLLAARLPDRVGPLPMIVSSALLEAAGLLTIALASTWWVAALGAVLAGGGFTLLYPALALVAIRRTPVAERGATLGAVSSFLDLSILVAGTVGGAVAGAGYATVFVLAATVALLAPTAARRPATPRTTDG